MPLSGATLLDETGPSRVDRIGPLCALLRAVVSKLGGLEAARLDRLELALSEAATNAVIHAHGSDPARPLRVVARTERPDTGPRLVVEVHDDGPGLDSRRLADHPPDELVEHGRGLFLIRSCVDEVQYERGLRGNVLRLVCRLRS